jgi:hypothetical protein
MTFNRDLMQYLIWYNKNQVHKRLNNQTPINSLLSILPKECHTYRTYTHA